MAQTNLLVLPLKLAAVRAAHYTGHVKVSVLSLCVLPFKLAAVRAAHYTGHVKVSVLSLCGAD